MIISFSSAKGGVSKTTSCVNLAYAISLLKPKSRILIIDLDPQSGATHHLSEKFNKTFRATILEVLQGKCEIDYAVHKYSKNLHIIPNSSKFRKLSFLNFEENLKTNINKISNSYDFIFFDLAPSMYEGATVPLFLSDYIVIPVNCPQGLSLLGLQAQAEIIVEVRKDKNKKLDVLGIIPSFLDRTKISKQVLEFLKTNYKDDVFPAIRRSTTISQASSLGKTIFEHAPNSNGVKDFTALAEEFIKRISKQTKKKQTDRKKETTKAVTKKKSTPKKKIIKSAVKKKKATSKTRKKKG